MEFNIELQLPDMSYVLQNQFYCSNCYVKITPKDPKHLLQVLSNSKDEFLKHNQHNEELYNLNLSILKLITEQIADHKFPDYFILQCYKCQTTTTVRTTNLANFIMEKTLENKWNKKLRISVYQNKFQIIS